MSDRPCSTDPAAPHGFDRSASHAAGRYVCECEGWEPPKRKPGRPPLPAHLKRGDTPARTVRLTDEEWAELRRRGVDALRAWLRTPV